MSWLSEFLRLLGRPYIPPIPLPPVQPPASGTDAEIILAMLNQVRRVPLRLDDDMVADAINYSVTMNRNGRLVHRWPLPPNVHGEIIAYGYTTPQAAFHGWLTSPGHNAIMMDSQYGYCGFGRSGNYWTGVFQ